jgi:hypothetical protein
MKYTGTNPGNMCGSRFRSFEWELGRRKEHYYHDTTAGPVDEHLLPGGEEWLVNCLLYKEFVGQVAQL